jgi:amino acid adenylation domain-containing protein
MEPQQIQAATDAEFLDLLRERDIVLSMHGGKLRISAPAGTMDEGIKRELVRRKTMLLSHIQQAEKEDIAPVAEDGIKRAPLSYAQERLWTLERFHPGNFAYNIPEISEVAAAIDPELMQQAIDSVVQRHETLRTSIREDEQGVPWQYVLPEVQARLEFLDLTQFEAAAKEEQLQSVVRELAHQPFDLQKAPLVRFHLFKMERQRHVVFINIHHIVSDRWSMHILYRELLDAYKSFAQGGQPDLPPLPIQYAEYATRERSKIAPGIEKQLQYWRGKLANPPEPPRLPFRRKSAQGIAFEGANYPIQFTAEDTTYIRALARQHGASVYMLLLAAYFALLYRFTGTTDVCIGGPFSERTRTDTERLIGLFVNTLVLRCSVDPGKSFSDLLHTVRETVLDAQANHEAPLQRILAEVQPARGNAGHSLFETMLVFDRNVGHGSGPTTTGAVLDPGHAKFDLLLQLNEEQEQISGWFEYRTDLFAQEDIGKLASSFLLLVRGAVHDPERAVGKLAFVSAVEKEKLRFWNETAREFPRDKAIHDLFEEQVEKSPKAIAAVHGTSQISYEELNHIANRIAHGLLATNTAPGSIVGIHLERSLTMIGAMLGILKAGCAYLPLDPSYPEERLGYMVRDSGCSCVLSEAWLDESPAENIRVCSPAFPHLEEAATQRNPMIAVSPEDLAYVIYTSGSTGKPKGVAIEHHSAVSFLHWARNTFPVDVLRDTLASTSISFDLSVFEIFLPLITGQTVILAKDILEIASLPSRSEVTIATTVPSAMIALLEAKCIPDTLRTIHLAGEPLTQALVERIYAETSVTTVNDLYGPTETTTYSTWTPRMRGGEATIGKPIDNTRVYIVDASLELVPIGIPGELLIAGEGVARGYLARPELTAEKFVSLTHLGEQGRAYRTGDLCSWTANGTLTCHGRIDSQVKVRGYRIELGEIEAVLLSFPGVIEAVATTTTDADLMAAVRLDEKASLDIPALIAHQAVVLPAFMVVRRIFALDEIPRTANGKVDRARVASLFIPETSDQRVQEPGDPLERQLVAIWEEAFGRSALGMDDDFFQLGGQSLLALRIFSEIEKRLGCKLMLSVLFEASTIRGLAERIRHAQKV